MGVPITNPLVAVVMGSDSDWSVMSDAAQALKDFGIEYEVEVLSAHRTPERMIDWGKTAASRGIKVIIAGAGGAAHLPGMLASVTTLPVVGVPVPLGKLDGMDRPAEDVKTCPLVACASAAGCRRLPRWRQGPV